MEVHDLDVGAKHLHWLIPTMNSSDIGLLNNSNLASIRLRCIPSALAAQQIGWKITYGEVIPDESSVIVVGKNRC
jgi:hypothetical protein